MLISLAISIPVQHIWADEANNVNAANNLGPQFKKDSETCLKIQPSRSGQGWDILWYPLNMLENTANIDRNAMILMVETSNGDYEHVTPTPECNSNARYPSCQYKVDAMACQSRRSQSLSAEQC